MATEKRVVITIKTNDDGTTHIEVSEGREIGTLAILWVHVMLAIDAQTEPGSAPGVDFLKETVARYNAKFAQ